MDPEAGPSRQTEGPGPGRVSLWVQEHRGASVTGQQEAGAVSSLRRGGPAGVRTEAGEGRGA